MTTSNSRKRASGFTLIEIMIVVAIVAILAAIAYPSYADHVRKSRRGQAKADLMEIVQLLERYRTVNNRYNGFDITDFNQSPRDGTARYTVTLENADADSYDLVATPTPGGGQEDDTRCLALSINQAGVKDISSTTGTVAACW